MENRIDEQPLGQFAYRTSTATMRANQLRLRLSATRWSIICVTSACACTELARAQVSTFPTRLLKSGARLTVSVRRLVASGSSAFPLQAPFAQVWPTCKPIIHRGYERRAGWPKRIFNVVLSARARDCLVPARSPLNCANSRASSTRLLSISDKNPTRALAKRHR